MSAPIASAASVRVREINMVSSPECVVMLPCGETRLLGHDANDIVHDLQEATLNGEPLFRSPVHDAQCAASQQRHERCVSRKYTYFPVIRRSDDGSCTPFVQGLFG